jgi:hypothetical protein
MSKRPLPKSKRQYVRNYEAGLMAAKLEDAQGGAIFQVYRTFPCDPGG